MIFPELGQITLIAALGFAFLQACSLLLMKFASSIFVTEKIAISLKALYKSLTLGQCFFILISFFILMMCFVNNDFSVLYVAEHSNLHLPIFYKLAAVWGGHEGSLLLWMSILSIWALIIQFHCKQLDEKIVAAVTAVFGFLSVGFLLFIILTSNPFARILPNIPSDGIDLNPMLQDPGLIFHPPLLYTGYVGFAASFAFALGLLIAEKFERSNLIFLQPLVIWAWVFLTLGITLGSFWAYYELGWGGFWFWDPVENASLLPWLSGTALLHSLASSKKQNNFLHWTIIFSILSFSLSLLGTFLVRSGVLTSVHAFANDPKRGLYILAYFSLTIFLAFIIYACKADKIPKQNYIVWPSRPGFLLINNLILLVILATVFLGTVYPLVLDALSLGKISVGAPYFNKVITPLAFLLMLFLGFAPISSWHKNSWRNISKQLWPIALAANFIVFMIIFLTTNKIYWQFILSLILAFWIIATILFDIFNLLKQKRNFTASYLGMAIAHFGVAILAIGVAASSFYSIDKDISFSLNEEKDIAGYQINFSGLSGVLGENYKGVRGDFLIKKNDIQIAILKPEKRIYTAQGMPMSETAIHSNLLRDIYIALAEPLGETTWAVRIYYKPFVRFIWLGGILMALGGIVLAIFPKRRKINNG